MFRRFLPFCRLPSSDHVTQSCFFDSLHGFRCNSVWLNIHLSYFHLEHFVFLLSIGCWRVISDRWQRENPFLSCSELKTDIFVAWASFSAVGEVLLREASWKLSRAVDDLYVPWCRVFRKGIGATYSCKRHWQGTPFQFERSSSQCCSVCPMWNRQADRCVIVHHRLHLQTCPRAELRKE